MTDTNGQQENDSRIQNEEHNHTATAKRIVLVDSAGAYITGTHGIPVNILGGTMYATILNATISVELDKDDDSVTVWQPTASNLKAQVSGNVSATVTGSATITGTVSIDNYPSGFTNTISGTVSATILNTVNATAYQGTDPWNVGFVRGVSRASDGLVTASATAVLVCSETNRLGTFVQNQSPTNNVWLGGSSDVTNTSNYFAKLGPGDVYTSFIKSTHYAITSTNTATLSFVIG